MSDSMDKIPVDFYTDAGFLISITIPSVPEIGDQVTLDGKLYAVKKKTWDFDVGGIPLLVRINVD